MWKQQKIMSAYITVTVMTDSIERFLNMCRHKNIGFWKISETEQGFTANITREDFFQLKDICRKTKTTVRISKRHGIRFLLFRYRRHSSFLSALPRHVLFYTAAACMSGIFHLRVITDIPQQSLQISCGTGCLFRDADTVSGL